MIGPAQSGPVKAEELFALNLGVRDSVQPLQSCLPGLEGRLCCVSMPFLSLPTLLQKCCSLKSLWRKLGKRGQSPLDSVMGRLNSIESLDWLSNGLKFSHDFNGKPFQEVLSDDGPLNLMDSHLNRPAD